MSVGVALEKVSDDLAVAKARVDVMLIRRRVSKEYLAVAITRIERALVALKEVRR